MKFHIIHVGFDVDDTQHGITAMWWRRLRFPRLAAKPSMC